MTCRHRGRQAIQDAIGYLSGLNGATLGVVVDTIAGHRQAHGAVPADPNDDLIIAAAWRPTPPTS